MMNRVCFISVYFGEIPNKMHLFLKSCKWNPKFDWLLVSDHEIPFNDISSNVKSIKLSQENFRERLSSVSGIEIPKFLPYKVCDFRPAFGDIFKYELEGYEFWGISDMDMILGNLSDFITDDLLNNFDKIYTFGHLSLIRNTAELNTIYKLDTPNSRNFKQVFQNPLSCVYDEYEGFTEKIVDCNYRVYCNKECADIYKTKNRIKICDINRFKLIQYRNNYSNYCEKKNYKYQLFTIDRGRIIKYFLDDNSLKKREYAYIHKLEYENEYDLNKNSRYVITVDGLIKCDDFFNLVDNESYQLKYFIEYNNPRLLYENFKFLCLYVRLKIRRLRKAFLPRRDEI